MNTNCCPKCGSPVNLNSELQSSCTNGKCKWVGDLSELVDIVKFLHNRETQEVNGVAVNEIIGRDVDEKVTATPKGLLVLSIGRVFGLHIDDKRPDAVWKLIEAWMRETYAKNGKIPIIAFTEPTGEFAVVDSLESTEEDEDE